MVGISRERYGADNSKHGFVLTSMSQGFMSSSIMKSYPNIYTHFTEFVTYLESVVSSVRIDLPGASLDSVSCHFLELRDNFLDKVAFDVH
jgi:hypothetical protein